MLLGKSSKEPYRYISTESVELITVGDIRCSCGLASIVRDCGVVNISLPKLARMLTWYTPGVILPGRRQLNVPTVSVWYSVYSGESVYSVYSGERGECV